MKGVRAEILADVGLGPRRVTTSPGSLQTSALGGTSGEPRRYVDPVDNNLVVLDVIERFNYASNWLTTYNLARRRCRSFDNGTRGQAGEVNLITWLQRRLPKPNPLFEMPGRLPEGPFPSESSFREFEGSRVT